MESDFKTKRQNATAAIYRLYYQVLLYVCDQYHQGRITLRECHARCKTMRGVLARYVENQEPLSSQNSN
jgi:hypothetical protein